MNYSNLLFLISPITLFVSYCFAEGRREGYYYYMKSLSGKIDENFNEHAMFTSQRILVEMILVNSLWFISLDRDIETFIPFTLFVACLFIFPFIHDYTYYQTRNVLTPGVYPFGVNSQSKDSQSVIDHAKIGKRNISTPGTRMALFIIGVIIILFDLIYVLLK